MEESVHFGQKRGEKSRSLTQLLTSANQRRNKAEETYTFLSQIAKVRNRKMREVKQVAAARLRSKTIFQAPQLT